MQAINEIARESCLHWRSEMSRDAIIGFDWSWDYRQGSSQCIFDFLNQRLKKIFNDDVAGNICSGLEGNFSSASSAMEVARLNNLLSL
jgi:hypothetical protein